MKLVNRLGLRQSMSFFKLKGAPENSENANSNIRKIFGEIEQISSKQVNIQLQVQKSLLAKSRKLIEQNKKVIKYHHYQYYRGEDFIEKIPYYNEYKYTAEDQFNEELDKQRRAIEELQPVINHANRSKLMREKIPAYHDKQRRYQLQQFEKYLNEYPGTVKGPRPEDDWQAYRDYGLKKIPKILIDQINEDRIFKEQLESAKSDFEDEQIYQRPKIATPTSLLSYFAKDRDLLQLDDENADEKTQQANEQNQAKDEEIASQWDQPLTDQYKTEIPLIPNTNFQNYQHFVNHWMSWLNFRNYYTQANLTSNMQKLAERFHRLAMNMDTDPQNLYGEIPANIPSLYRYYKCLPKSMQDHPGMKDIYLGLQYTSPDFTYEQKEDALNYTCRYLLPFDQISNKVMVDYTARSRFYPTPYIYDKIFTISPQFTWDIKTFLQEIRRQELKGQTSNQNKELRYAQPPEVHKIWEQGAPNLPVDFYDNDDGFWDSIISQKLKRYDQHKPMLKTRRYFTH